MSLASAHFFFGAILNFLGPELFLCFRKRYLLFICKELPTGATVGFPVFANNYLVFEVDLVHFGLFYLGDYRWLMWINFEIF